MSARAAWRLASLGVTGVSRYEAGMMDWLAAGLPTEGHEADTPRASDAARRDVPTCALHDTVGEARRHVDAAGWRQCIVVNEQRVVLGRLRGKALTGDAEQPVEAVMENGPTTVRPSEPLEALIGRMQDKLVGSIIVTTPDGVLVGVLQREDGARELAERAT